MDLKKVEMVGDALMVLAVVYTERGDDVIRIISARAATKEEKEEYYGYR